MIGRLALSSRNLYKISKDGKMVSARKCYILSENSDDILVPTNKDFNTKDIYVLIDKNTNMIKEVYGTVGDPIDDLNIYHHMYTLNWISNKKYLELWKKYDFNPEYDIVQRVDYYRQVITIDPLGSVDLDDGYSLWVDESKIYLDIHIADPVSFFDFTKPEMNQIFEEFLQRINTCYIPNTKGSGMPIHLLPESIVKYVSLLELKEEINYRRGMSFCFKFSFEYILLDFEIKHTKLYNLENKTYEQFDKEINSNPGQKNILVELSNQMISQSGMKIGKLNSESDISHGMIEVFMIWVNLFAGQYLNLNSDKMITRIQDNSELPDNIDSLPKYCINFLNHSANYKLSIKNEIENLQSNFHYSLGINNYCHVSSPMRRVIDMLNHLIIYKTNIDLFDSKVNLDKINEKLKIQKKISNAYDLLSYLKVTNKFKAFVMDLKVLESKSYLLLVVYTEPDFKKMINVELPMCIDNLNKYQEINIEIYYNPVKFKTSKFPFDIKIL